MHFNTNVKKSNFLPVNVDIIYWLYYISKLKKNNKNSIITLRGVIMSGGLIISWVALIKT